MFGVMRGSRYRTQCEDERTSQKQVLYEREKACRLSGCGCYCHVSKVELPMPSLRVVIFAIIGTFGLALFGIVIMAYFLLEVVAR